MPDLLAGNDLAGKDLAGNDMVTVVEGPGSFRRHDHVPIPLADGTRLGARIWIPDGAEAHPVPAILEYLPYRKNDLFAVADEGRFGYFAAHGYAGVRLDIRGSGDSDGVLVDEYLLGEQDDALEAISWIASQPWCSGAVGMIGMSWGGFNGLQVAARRPPALKAVVTAYSTDDRYADDAHYIGGCLLTPEMLGWGTTMHTVATLPPDPESVGELWKQMWTQRLEAFHPQIHTWLSHQRRDDYWKHGSVNEDYADITCAVFAIGGWCDGYRDPVFRLMEGLSCPKKALIGPWAHKWPMEPFEPGPHIGFLQECIRFFDQFLKGEDTGFMAEPMLRVWLQDPVAPATHYPERPGRWGAEPSWPSPNVSARRMFLNEAGFGEKAGDERPLAVRGAQVAGEDAGEWCAFGRPLDAPADQRAEDGRSLCFTSAPLTEPLEILGFPVAHLVLASDQPRALVAVRLCDVSETGESLLVTRGLLNLTHRKSHELPRAHGPRGAHRRLGSAAVHRPGGPGRPPLAGRHLAHVLPLGLALAGPGHPHRVLGCELARAARARLEPARRGPAAPRPAGGRPEDRDRGARGGDGRGPDHARSPHREDRVGPVRLAGARPASRRARDVRLARFLLLDHRGRSPLGPLPRRQDCGARPRQLGDPPRR